jgi:uncharacterized protein YigA (DUF484 family)
VTTDEAGWATDIAAFRAEHDLPVGGPLAQEFARLTQNLLHATSVADVLDQVVRAAHRVVPGADLVSITLRSPSGEFHTPAETDSAATRLDSTSCSTRPAKAPA